MTIRAYIALAVLLAFMTVSGVALYYRAEAADAAKEAQQAIADKDKAVEANKAAQNTISALQEQSRLDSRLTASLVEEMRKISDGLAEQSQQIDELEKSNAAVADFLAQKVPEDLRRLYKR